LAVLGVLAAAALGGAAAGCDQDERGTPPGAGALPGPGGHANDPEDPNHARVAAALATPAASLAKYLGVDAGELEVPIDPPAPAGDLKTEIDHFTTIDACVDARAQLDPLLGDALEAIGYDTFLRDACRIVDAAKAHDADRCAAIDASGLEARCRATVAEVGATPGSCPWEASSRPARGREPKCVAIASRSAGLCEAVDDRLDRATCKATVTRSERPCLGLRGRSEQIRCVRDAARWRGLLSSDDTKPAEADAAEEPPAVQGTLHIESADPADKTAPIDVDLGPDLARGVTLVAQLDGIRLAIGSLTETGLDFIAPSPHVRASLALGLFVPVGGAHGDGSNAPQIERAELLVPGRPPVSTPGAHSTLVAKLDKLTLRRGAAVPIAVDGDLTYAGSRWRVHVEATTFVRDVVRASELYRGGPRLGVDAGMR
jgi:hypothetical protein